MKRTYYVHYWNNFGNTYNLYYCETEEDLAALPADSERITRKEALRLAREESYRRETDQSFAYLADESIIPAAEKDKPTDWFWSNHHFELRNRIWERI